MAVRGCQWFLNGSCFVILKGFKVAYIVFKKASSLQKALQLDSSELRYFSTEEKPVDTGINSMLYDSCI